MDVYNYDVSLKDVEDYNISNCNNIYNEILTVIENIFCNLSMH